MAVISVIIPVYNKIRYLAAMLEDLQKQTFGDYECILIDDGSTDGSGRICDDFAKDDSRFLVTHIPNGGVSHARNVGLEQARGEYLTFADADDRLHPEYLQNLYDCITQSGADMVIGGVKKFWADSDRTFVAPMPCSGKRLHKDVLADFAQIQQETGVYGCCTAKLFPRRLAKDVCFDESLCLAEDFDFYLRLYPGVQSIYFSDKPYYYYLQAAENSSVLVRDDQIDYMAQLQIQLRYRNFLRSQGAYTEKNQSIVETQIGNYLYFSLFYCPMEEFDRRFRLLSEIRQTEKIVTSGKGAARKFLTLFLRMNTCLPAKWCLGGYRALRHAFRRKKD